MGKLIMIFFRMDFITWILITVLAYAFYLYATWNYNRFKDSNVPHQKPLPFFGNLASFLFRLDNMIENGEKIYNKFPNNR